nr:PLP-dependent aminotransferase family protein [Paenibacillus caui]
MKEEFDVPDFALPWETAVKTYRYKYLAMYHAIRSVIRDGTLPKGSRLPASRELAAMYGLSRGSVAQAYDMLLAEGYVYARVGQGTFVAPNFAGADLAARGEEGAEDGKRESAGEDVPDLPLSSWGRRLLAQSGQEDVRGGKGSFPEEDGPGHPDRRTGIERSRKAGADAGARMDPKQEGTEMARRGRQAGRSAPEPREAAGPSGNGWISFAEGGPGAADFPHAAWRSALSRAAGDIYGPADVFGDAGLRAAIAAHLRASRGIAAEPASICCFSGSMQAIALLSQLLLGEGARAVVEDPGYPGIRRAAAATGAAVIPAEVDGRGMIPRDWDAQVLYVTPGRQFPTGAVLAPERRRELLAWAQRRGAVIVEDDFDSEFRWGGRPMEPLMAQDPGGRVVFVGSFTKPLFPALRLGYAVLPPQLVQPVRLAKSLYEPYSPAQLEQRSLARFMARGDYDKHLRRMRRIYGLRHETFHRELESRLGGLFTPLASYSGLHVYALWRRSKAEYEAFRSASRSRGVSFRDASGYWIGDHPPAACFFFGHLEPEAIVQGMERLADAKDEILANGSDIV